MEKTFNGQADSLRNQYKESDQYQIQYHILQQLSITNCNEFCLSFLCIKQHIVMMFVR